MFKSGGEDKDHYFRLARRQQLIESIIESDVDIGGCELGMMSTTTATAAMMIVVMCCLLCVDVMLLFIVVRYYINTLFTDIHAFVLDGVIEKVFPMHSRYTCNLLIDSYVKKFKFNPPLKGILFAVVCC